MPKVAKDNTVNGQIETLNTHIGKTIKDITNMGSSGIYIEFTDGTELELQADYDYQKEYAILIVNYLQCG